MPPHRRTSSPLHVALLCALALTALPAAAARLLPPADGAVSVMRPLPTRDAEGGMWAVELDLARLRAARAGEMLRLDLPDGRRIDIVFDSSLGSAEGMQWIGHHVAGRQYAVRLHLVGERATGILRTPDGGFVLGHVNGVQIMGADLSVAAGPMTLDGLPSLFLAADNTAAADGPSGGSESRARPPADVAHPVSFNLLALSALESGDDVMLSIPEHGDYRVRYDRTDAGDADTTTWVGHLADYGSEFRIIVTSGPDGSVGNIMTPSGELMLVDDGRSQWLVDPVRSGLSQFESEHADAVGEEVPAAAGEVMAMGGTTAAADAGTTGTVTANSGATANGSETQIDLLVLYTPGFKKKHGSMYGTRIAQLVALANQAYIDSGVPMRLRLVASAQVNDSDTTSNSTTLSALARGTGAYRTVPALRKKYGADLVTVVRPFYMTAQGGSCGVGYVGGYNGSNIAYYGNYAYSVVSDGRDMAGSYYYCTDYTFTHELGHNMGLMHDRATVTRQGGGSGSHPYAFGHGRSGSFGSIMSYISPVIGRFSNPDLTDCGGSFACGVAVTDPASAHNAMALSNNRTAVSSWRSTTVPTTYQVSGTISRGGKPLANVALSATDGATCTASGRTGAYACTVPWGWSGVITPQPTVGSARPANLLLTTVKAAQKKRNFVVR